MSWGFGVALRCYPTGYSALVGRVAVQSYSQDDED